MRPLRDGAAVSTARSHAVRALHLLPLGLMVAIVLVAYGVIVWTLPRGFDWTDEAFIDSMIASNRITVGEPWGFQHLLNPLYVLTGESVLAFRILRLGGYVVLSVALVWCARAVVRRIGITIARSGWVFILVLAQMGTFAAWSYPPRYLGHNELASWFAQVGIALILLSLAWGVSSPDDQRAARVLWPIWAGLGAVTTVLVFAKVTSGVVFGAVLALVLLVPNPGLRLWKRGAAAGAGAAAVLFVLWVSGYPVRAYSQTALSVLFDTSAQDDFGHPISELVAIYGRSLFATGAAVLPVLLLFTLTMAAFLRTARPVGGGGGHDGADRMSWILGMLLLLALVVLPKANVWEYLGVMVVFIGLAGIIGLVILGSEGVTMHGSAVCRAFSVVVGGSAIVAAPFISSAGTNNPITGHFLFAATLWAVVLGIALVLLTERGVVLRSSARVVPALIACVVLLMGALAVKASTDTPYRTAPLRLQETTTSVPELRGLLLTEADADWIDWISAVGDSLGADDVPAIAIASPGALYVFNHSGYANPWIDQMWPAAFSSLRVACTTDPPSDLFVLQPGASAEVDLATPGVTESLAACGIDFPGDFRVVDEYVSADSTRAMTIWRLAVE